MPDDARLEVKADEREILVHELDGFIEMTAALWRQIGRDWDARDPSALTPDVALVVRAREQLDGGGPWTLTGGVSELEFLFGRLRAGAELALQRGAQPSPRQEADAVAMHSGDAQGTDSQLDMLGVVDALSRRLAGE